VDTLSDLHKKVYGQTVYLSWWPSLTKGMQTE